MNSDNESKKNILLVAITRLGDMLQASPTIVGLKQENPGARITVLIDKSFANVCNGIPGIDEIRTIDLGYISRCLQEEKEGVVEAYRYVEDLVSELRLHQYDFCINMASASYTAMLIKLLDVKDSRGWMSDDEGFRLISSPWSMLFAAYVYHSNRDYNGLNLVDIFRCSTGVTAHPKKLVYTFTDSAQQFVEKFFKDENLTGTGPIVCIQAGASQDKRQWAPARFAHVARLLVEQLDARIVYTGAASEKNIVDAIQTIYTHSNITSAVGRTNFDSLAALLAKADLLITGDTGPMHMAVAVGTPVVAIFLASALCFETGPYSEGNIVLQPQISCNPCNPNFPCSRPDCHEQVRPELVCELVRLRLATANEKVRNLRIPREIADPREVMIYASTFDDDNFLRFISTNGAEVKKGQREGYYDAARESYRTLWKEEFQVVEKQMPLNENGSKLLTEGMQALPFLENAIRYTQEGLGLIETLRQLIVDEQSPPQRLGETMKKIDYLDRQLDDLGLSNPIIGVIIRMFVMGKENMRGEDPLQLASQMGEHYETLGRRLEKFGKLYAFNMNRQRPNLLRETLCSQ